MDHSHVCDHTSFFKETGRFSSSRNDVIGQEKYERLIIFPSTVHLFCTLLMVDTTMHCLQRKDCENDEGIDPPVESTPKALTA